MARRRAVATVSPLDYTGLLTWYDMADTSTLSSDTAGTTPAVDDGPVGRIADKSGTNRHATQATSGNRPTLQTGALNSLATLAFDGNDYMSMTSLNPSTAMTTGFTIFAAFTAEANGSYGWIYGDAAGSATFLGKTAGQDILHGVASSWTWPPVNYSNTPVIGGAHVTAHTVSSAALTVHLDGTLKSTITPGGGASTTTTQLALGGRPSVSEFWRGTIAELAIYNRALTGTERGEMEEYLTAKWGVA